MTPREADFVLMNSLPVRVIDRARGLDLYCGAVNSLNKWKDKDGRARFSLDCVSRGGDIPSSVTAAIEDCHFARDKDKERYEKWEKKQTS